MIKKEKNHQYDKNGKLKHKKVKLKAQVLDNILSPETKEFVKGSDNVLKTERRYTVFDKNSFSFSVKDIENGEKLIEAEADDSIEEMNTLDKIKVMFDKYEIPIYKDNYFVKKAELELLKQNLQRNILLDNRLIQLYLSIVSSSLQKQERVLFLLSL